MEIYTSEIRVSLINKLAVFEYQGVSHFGKSFNNFKWFHNFKNYSERIKMIVGINTIHQRRQQSANDKFD